MPLDIRDVPQPLAAQIDRRIEIVAGTLEQQSSIRRVSDLRTLPFIVILGEPGIGKSTVFDLEAANEKATVLKVRDFVTGDPSGAGKTLFIDALDEYRAEGERADKVQNLAAAISAANAKRWRLSCRAEDWRKEADTKPLERVVGEAVIVVAQLLPLDNDEASSLLCAFGEKAPKAFLEKAQALGASGLVESPLSLKLLQKAVADGTWPSTRFELFASAITSLAHERNQEHKWTQRHSPDDIIAAAGQACLIFLLSGAQAIWRSNDEPPIASMDSRVILTAHDLRLDHKLLRDVLDTPLFRGDGETFEPIHRTVAEYLAAQALANAVMGVDELSPLPFSRALAFITWADGRPPTELRGLYAWFATHLAKLGEEVSARRLIESDAATVLAYGDAAVFELASRRAILTRLEHGDPYFRVSQIGVTAIGGLASEDLASDFEAVLTTDPPDSSHLLLTVFDVLKYGRPVTSVRPFLRRLALDPERPVWQRTRAADGWLNGAKNRVDACRQLFDATEKEPVSVGREALRAHLAAMLPSSLLSIPDIKSIIADFERFPEDDSIGHLFDLQRKLEAEPRPELFDEPVQTWLSNDGRKQIKFEVNRLLNLVLAASIHKTRNLSAARLWRWTANVRNSVWLKLEEEAVSALSAWLDLSQTNEIAFFEAILADDRLDNGPWVAGNTYFAVTNRSPSAAVIRYLLSIARKSSSRAVGKRYLKIAVEIVRSPSADFDTYWETYHCLTNQPGCKMLLDHLTKSKIPSWMRKDAKRKIRLQRQRAKDKAHNINVLSPSAEDLRIGKHQHHLDWAAGRYLRSEFNKNEMQSGAECIISLTGEVLADAIFAGWEHLATKDFVDVDAALLGQAEAENRRYLVERPAIVGLDRIFETDRPCNLEAAPIVVAVAILKTSWIVEDEGRRDRLVKWAIDRLNLEPTEGAAQLVDFWSATLDSGGTELRSIALLSGGEFSDEATARALYSLLNSHRSMAPEALRAALHFAAKFIDRARLLTLAETALADPSVINLQRAIWSFVAFVLDPIGHSDRILLEQSDKKREVSQLFSGSLSDGFFEALFDLDCNARACRESTIVRLLGPICCPEDGWQNGFATDKGRHSEIVRSSISWLSTQSDSASGAALADLIANAELTSWLPNLRHAQAQHFRLRRDRSFAHPKPVEVLAAIAGGPPISSSDLGAIVVEELHRLRAELRTNDTTPWKRYWNVDSHGNVANPLIENECRDHLLDRLRDRLKPYRISAAVPEAQRGEKTRADMLILTGAGRTLPVEAKRHFHPDVWVAASTQLQDYVAGEDADGFGIYLVFWFGIEVSYMPARPGGENGPKTAEEMESVLRADLPADLQARTTVIVFDVSNPNRSTQSKPRKKRADRKS